MSDAFSAHLARAMQFADQRDDSTAYSLAVVAEAIALGHPTAHIDVAVPASASPHDPFIAFPSRQDLRDAVERSPYRLALDAVADATHALNEASLREWARVAPPKVHTLIFAMNDTPRLSFDAFIAEDGVELDAEEIDGNGEVYDSIDTIAANLGWHDPEDADNVLARYDVVRGAQRWLVDLDLFRPVV